MFSLIEYSAELEALEDAEDLKDAREALAEVKTGAGVFSGSQAGTGEVEFANTGEDVSVAESGQTISYDHLRRELGLDR